MSDTILLIGHGSRDPAGNPEVEDFAQRWRRRRPEWTIELCFIELAEVLLDEGLARAAQDARRVIVVPLLLSAASHVKMEIPEHIAKARTRHPDTEFVYTPPLGAGDPIFAILKRRLKQVLSAMDMPDPKTTGIVLLSRGSSDRRANGEVAKMARWLQEDSEHELIDIAFTDVAHPRLERAVQRQVQLGMTQLAVLPYYLFNGTLIKRIKRQIGHLARQYPAIRFAHSEHIGFEEEIFSLLEQRVREAGHSIGLMPCDGCQYRAVAQQHGLPHRHAENPPHPATELGAP